jgi:hypothetical protein
MDRIAIRFRAQRSTTPPRGHVNVGPTHTGADCGGDSATGHSSRSHLITPPVPLRSLSPCSRLVFPDRRREPPDPSFHLAAGGARWDKSDLSAVCFSARARSRDFFLSVASTWSASGERRGIPIWSGVELQGRLAGGACTAPVMDRAELATEQVSAWGCLPASVSLLMLASFRRVPSVYNLLNVRAGLLGRIKRL